MRSAARLVLAGLSVLVLSACEPQRPAVAPPAASGSVGADRDVSVPSAASVLTPAAPASTADTAAGRTNKSMSRAEESSGMPMAGQNNDHSAPAAAAQPGSGASKP